MLPTPADRAGIGLGACLLFFVGALLLASPGAAETTDLADAELEAEPLVQDLFRPTNIDVAPDGSIWYTEIGGDVSRYDPVNNTTGTVRQVQNVVTGGERGLLGMALAGDFEQTGDFYLYYTHAGSDEEPEHNRLVRISGGQEHRILTVPAAEQHNGGRILVHPNGSLFVGTGENQQMSPAREPDNHLGKILHLYPDGTPVESNIQGYVHTVGHRNVYGLAYDNETDHLFATENSGWRADEINLIEAGNNYGYPDCEGHNRLAKKDEPCPKDQGLTFPIATFYDDRTAAPTGATVRNGSLFWGSFNEGTIHRLSQDPDTGEWNDTIIYEHDEPIFHVATGPDEELYFSATEGIYRLEASQPEDVEGGIAVGVPAPALPAVAAALTLVALATRRSRGT